MAMDADDSARVGRVAYDILGSFKVFSLKCLLDDIHFHIGSGHFAFPGPQFQKFQKEYRVLKLTGGQVERGVLS
jgi:hypothetical protein